MVVIRNVVIHAQCSLYKRRENKFDESESYNVFFCCLKN